jgi:hypothetical protein
LQSRWPRPHGWLSVQVVRSALRGVGGVSRF